MERLIAWDSYCYDDISLVYDKAEGNEQIGNLLSALERAALAEVEAFCDHGKLTAGDAVITKEIFRRLQSVDQEMVLHTLGRNGLAHMEAMMNQPKIVVKFSPAITQVMACTMFNVIHRLEKLDGAYNAIRFKEATLELQVPLGGRKGLVQWEMLIMQLYPWLSVSEVSSGEVALEALGSPQPVQPAPAAPVRQPVQSVQQPQAPKEEPKKKGLFSRLFGK